MKIKLLKDLPEYKAGHIFDNDCINISVSIDPDSYPEFFQEINDNELIEELADHLTGKPYLNDGHLLATYAIKYLREKGRLK